MVGVVVAVAVGVVVALAGDTGAEDSIPLERMDMDQTISISSTERLVTVRCWCGTWHAIPESLRHIQLKAQDAGRDHFVHCPLGHQYAPAGKSQLQLEKERAAREAAQLRSRLDYQETETRIQRERAEQLEKRRRAEKAAKTRLKNRVARGVCPCCNRHFDNLQRHIQHQHPDFAATANADEA